MIVSALGTSGGDNPQQPSACYWIDGNTLLDCGSGAATLSPANQLSIERVLLSRSHQDHCSGLLTLLATHARDGGNGITVYTQQETINELQQGLLLDSEYLQQSEAQGQPLLRFQAIDVGDPVPLADGMATALPTEHPVASVGWLIEGPWRALSYSGASALCPSFWHWSVNVPSLSDVICEVSYPDSLAALAEREGHMTPQQLLPMLALLPPNVHVWITHMQDKYRDQIMLELKQSAPCSLTIHELNPNCVIDL